MSRKTQELRALTALAESNGWAMLRRIMEDEIVAAAMMIAESPQMSQQEVDFRRGAIWAAKQLLDTPTRVIQRLEGDLRLDDPDDLNPPGV